MKQVTDTTLEERLLKSYEPLDRGWFNQRIGKEVTVGNAHWEITGTITKPYCGSDSTCWHYDTVRFRIKSGGVAHVRLRTIGYVLEKE